MKLEQVLTLNSERGIRSILSALIFGEKNRLLGAAVQHQRMTETVNALRTAGFDDRAHDIENGKAYRAAEERAVTSANRLQKLNVAGASRGLNIDVDVSPELRRVMDLQQIKLASEFSGVSEEEILDAATKAAQAQFKREEHASLTAKTLFYTANPDDTDIDVNTTTALAALNRERGRILTFSNILPYLGDVALLKTDIDTVEHIAMVEAEHEDENDGSVDNKYVSSTNPVAPRAPDKKAKKAKKPVSAAKLDALATKLSGKKARRIKKADAKPAEVVVIDNVVDSATEIEISNDAHEAAKMAEALEATCAEHSDALEAASA